MNLYHKEKDKDPGYVQQNQLENGLLCAISIKIPIDLLDQKIEELELQATLK